MSETSEEEAIIFESRAPVLAQTLAQAYPDVRRIPEIIELLRESYLGFEYCFNRTYAQANGIKHLGFDKFDPFHAQKIVRNLDDQIRMLTAGQLNLVEESLRAKKRPNIPVKKIRKNWEKYETKEGTPELDLQFRDDDDFKRDPVMEQNIRKNHEQGKTLVAIVGAVHTLESPEGITLYSKLKDLNPKRIILFKPLEPQL